MRRRRVDGRRPAGEVLSLWGTDEGSPASRPAAFYRALLNVLPFGTFECDATGSCRHVSQRSSEMLGLPALEALGMGWLGGVHPEDRERVTREWTQGIADCREISIEGRFQHPDGAVWWVHIVAGPVRGEGREVIAWVGFHLDVTERQIVQERLRESEERYRQLAERSADILARLSPDATILYISPAVRRIIGFAPENLVGRSTFDFVHPDEVAALRETLASALADRATKNVSYRFCDARGDWVWLESSFRVNDGPSGETEFIMVSRDVTERRQIESLRRDLVAMLSHDLRHPLATVLAFSSVLSANPDANERLEHLARIDANAKTALRLAGNFVHAARVDEGGMPARPVPGQLNDLVSTVVSRHSSRADLDQVCIVQRLDPTIGESSFDASLLERAVENLLANALRYSPRGGEIVIETRRRGDEVRVAVSDQGPGVPTADRGRLFQRFASIEGRRQAGTGLGLFIVRSIAEAHNGKVEAEFPSGGGSKFVIRLPIDAASRLAERDKVTPLRAAGNS